MNPPGHAPRRVAVAGVVDIANYGDQLLPLIAAYRMSAWDASVVPVAPVAEHRVRSDAMPPRALTWLMTTDEPIDAVLIGGGNIIYNLRVDYTARLAAGGTGLGLGLHSGIWLGAAMAPALRDVPFGFNAPGVPYPFSAPVAAAVLRPVLEAADIIAVRDEASARLAGASGLDIPVVPDTAIEIARLWPRATLDEPFRRLAARTGWDGAPYVAIHLRAGTRQADHIGAVARCLDRFCAEQRLRPVLVAIGDDLGDSDTARALKAAMTSDALVLDGGCSLREVAAALAHARLYMGGSLHGYVTAAAYGVPGIITTTQPHRKFAGFLAWMERPQDIAQTWEEACARGAAQLRAGEAVRVPARVWQALDAHWQAVAEMIANPSRRAPQRAALLRAMAARATARGGLEWLLSPWLAKTKRAAGA